MSELKCPACKTVLSKPLPECCPVCKLEGLNSMFLTLEDYEHWKTAVLDEHIKKSRNHRVSVGHDGVLVLLGDGRLFGFGNNTQGQYCPHRIGEKIATPEKIADNVISAAAGYNYSIYLDANGKVHFLGNSGIPFKERFDQSDFVFKEVYAKNNKDVFWAVDKNYKIYTWGAIGKEKIKPLKVFEPIKTEFEKITSYSNGVGFETGGTSGEIVDILIPDYMFISYGFEYSILSIKSTLDYKQLVKNYGECNLRIGYEFGYECKKELKEKLQNRFLGKKPMELRSLGYYQEKVLIKPAIYFLDRYIFNPIEENINKCETSSDIYIDNLRNDCFNNLYVDNRNGKCWSERYQDILRKIDLNKSFGYFSVINEACFDFFLEKNGTLHLYLVSQNSSYYKKLGQINDISDASGNVSDFYFIDRNKKLWLFAIPILELNEYDKKEYNVKECIFLVHEF